MLAYQFDRAGFFVGAVEADPSPLEPGEYLIPGGCTVIPPPAEIPEGQAARWDGVAWRIVAKPVVSDGSDESDVAVAKLRTFLAANPDVAAFLELGDL